MCGRFRLMTDQELKEIDWIISHLEDGQLKKTKTGEIFPTDMVPVIMVRDRSIRPWPMTWGFPHFKGSGVIINARSETAAVKTMFSGSVKQYRCVVPGTGFYEWKKPEKQKYLFRLPEEPVLYMAGLYREYGDESRFVILTTKANVSMKGVHDRMPLILRKSEIKNWMANDRMARQLLANHRDRPELIKELA
ncbi:SOS response-associated peptidase [Anoxynatronum buryatiense]|uniref:Abasic site processing protein n=1 Tax=Anoxynatronum buryatiense TaxID=489973 RepID=A0AA45WSK5_9CLOT|nr:SOS response-associated peptidase [Anoxynatronum buryatiense]SMP38145.1 Putative SOS response-associated peptidase YedK [Anoxynatronum buryatiense]